MNHCTSLTLSLQWNNLYCIIVLVLLPTGLESDVFLLYKACTVMQSLFVAAHSSSYRLLQDLCIDYYVLLACSMYFRFSKPQCNEGNVWRFSCISEAACCTHVFSHTISVDHAFKPLVFQLLPELHSFIVFSTIASLIAHLCISVCRLLWTHTTPLAGICSSLHDHETDSSLFLNDCSLCSFVIHSYLMLYCFRIF